MNELQKLYKEYSNRELITILYEKHKYTPEAIETALAEIKNRNLTQQEFDKEKNDIILQEENRKQQIQKARARRKQIQSFLNPVNTPKKIIAFVTISLSLFSLYHFYNQVNYYILSGGINDKYIPLSYRLYSYGIFLVDIITPIVLIMFYMRIKISWNLLFVCLLLKYLDIFNFKVIGPIKGLFTIQRVVGFDLPSFFDLPMLIISNWLGNHAIISSFEALLIVIAFILINKKSVRAYYK